MTAWLRRQFRDWPPAATAAATALLLVSPVAGFLYGDATRPTPQPVTHLEQTVPASTMTTHTERRQHPTTTTPEPSTVPEETP